MYIEAEVEYAVESVTGVMTFPTRYARSKSATEYPMHPCCLCELMIKFSTWACECPNTRIRINLHTVESQQDKTFEEHQ
jgi:hypothetical protein